MSYCPKCGAKVKEEMNFCPKCGASLKVEQITVEAAPPALPAPIRAEKYERGEKREKEEKHEKGEKEEKHEKPEPSFIGPLIGGFILMFVGFMFYLAVTASIRWEAVGALFFIIIGIVIIIGAVYAATTAARRHPKT